VERRLLDERFRFGRFGQQSFDLPAQVRIITAGAIQVGAPLRPAERPSLMIQPIDFAPAFRLHAPLPF
jgi:hypothetical protein